MKKPNFFIVGAAKAGTTSLYNYLKQHPQIYMSPIKEPNYFSKDIGCPNFNKRYMRELELASEKEISKYLNGPMNREFHNAYINSWQQYIKLFKKVKSEKAIGENSNSYLYSKVAAQRIKEAIPNAKIIIVLRNPTDRVFSHYLQSLRLSFTKLSFIDCLKKEQLSIGKGWEATGLRIDIGLYYEQVKRYFDIFPKENIKIYFFEDYKINTIKVIKNIFMFLGVDPDFTVNISRRYNKATIPRYKKFSYISTQIGLKNFMRRVTPFKLRFIIKKLIYTDSCLPTITREEKEYLQDIYKEDIQKLSILIDKDLSAWNKL